MFSLARPDLLFPICGKNPAQRYIMQASPEVEPLILDARTNLVKAAEGRVVGYFEFSFSYFSE